MKPPKGIKRGREAHTAPTKFGMGDYYGTGVKQKMGTIPGAKISVKKGKKPTLA